MTVFILFVLIRGESIYAATPSHPEYLIMQSIGAYHNGGKGHCGEGAGLLEATGHFSEDHDDITCSTDYYNTAQKLAVDIQVSKHAGGDSDKWLLHEVEHAFSDNETLDATYVSPNPLRDINGRKIFYTWGYYEWISNYVTVRIQFTDLTGTKPEPLEVVQAYLQKFPSTIPSSFVLDKAHKIQWIKDEMDRRLWLCTKWFAQLQLGTVEQKDSFNAAFESMTIFLNYREKYYGIQAADEKNLLIRYLETNNGTGIHAKLATYKAWWGTHKGDSLKISLHK